MKNRLFNQNGKIGFLVNMENSFMHTFLFFICQQNFIQNIINIKFYYLPNISLNH